MLVPGAPAALPPGAVRPPRKRATAAAPSPATRVVQSSSAAATIAASASPRKPSERTANSASALRSFEVACRSKASASSAGGIPQPSSRTRIRSIPPASTATAIRVAPASSAFSISSFTTEAGRSITSPAAIRAATSGGSTRIGARPPPAPSPPATTPGVVTR